jgi:hypothetical protein
LETTLRLCSRRKTNLQKLKLPKQSQKAKSQKFHLLLDLEGASQKAKSQKFHLLLDLEGARVFLEILKIPEDCLHKPPLKRPNNKSPKLKLNQTPSLYNNQNHKSTLFRLPQKNKKTNNKKNQQPLSFQ